MESARKLVRRIVDNLNYETIDLSASMKIAKLIVPTFWIGTSILSSSFEKKYEVKPIAYKHDKVWHTSFENDDILEKDDILVVLGDSAHIEELSKKV
jgi:trk system potassium uptake protein TrkA